MDVHAKAEAARRAASVLAASSDADRQAALHAMTRALDDAAADIQAANAVDLAAAQRDGLDQPLVDRLRFDAAKQAVVTDGLRRVAGLPDPVGRTLRSILLDDGLHLYQVTCPLGVLACIFESRPDVVVQIAGLAVRSGNAVLLKGGREATHTNMALAAAVRSGLSAVGLPEDAVQLLTDREEVHGLLALDDLVDLVIPRGSDALVRAVKEATRIPVLGHAEGVCTITVDATADPEVVHRVVLDAKTDAPSACNAVEALLVHADARDMIPDLVARLLAAGVTVHADDRVRAVLPDEKGRAGRDGARVVAAVPEDDGREYGSLDLLVRMVPDLDAALAYIARYGSKHTDAILTADPVAARRFVTTVDSAGVFVNASTRFADGYRYGLGAEVGIATGKLHARGPVGLEGLTTYRWILVGHGQTAAAYRARPFLHADSSEAYDPGTLLPGFQHA